jgi:predicted negative regulator of RcsB-dependent stress response
MMDTLSDFEQKELFKKWFREYGVYIALAIVLGLLIGFTVRGWNQYQQNKSEQASVLYQQVLAAESSQDLAQSKQATASLLKEFPKTSYAALAMLFQARDAVQTGNFDVAYQNLQWVLKNSSWAPIRQIARIRAARVLLQQAKANEALQLLATVDDAGFKPMIKEVQGDIYMKLGQVDKASSSYQAAKDQLLEMGSVNPILEMKLAHE